MVYRGVGDNDYIFNFLVSVGFSKDTVFRGLLSLFV